MLLINDIRAVLDWTKHNPGIVRPREYWQAICLIGGGTLSVKPFTT